MVGLGETHKMILHTVGAYVYWRIFNPPWTAILVVILVLRGGLRPLRQLYCFALTAPYFKLQLNVTSDTCLHQNYHKYFS